MARKVFGSSLRNAMEQGAAPEAAAPAPAPPLARTSPTVARAQASVIEEDKHATRLLDPNLIRMSAVMDRLDPSDGIDDLVASIRDQGQKVAILVRRVEGGYEIVYGRRRLLACRALGQKVRATVMDMTDEEALIAQGVENNARVDPSFIERALFVAGIIRELGKSPETRKNAQTVAYRALQIDESLVSRMNRIATAIPMNLIRAIGPAHGVGRRAWESLAKLCETDPVGAGRIAGDLRGDSSAARLELALARLSAPKAAPAPTSASPPVRMSRRGDRLTVQADAALMPRIEEAINRIIQEFLDRGQETGPDNPS